MSEKYYKNALPLSRYIEAVSTINTARGMQIFSSKIPTKYLRKRKSGVQGGRPRFCTICEKVLTVQGWKAHVKSELVISAFPEIADLILSEA